MTARTILAFGFAATLLGCDSTGPPSSGGDPGVITYWRDVKPILDAKCTGCHVAGGIAPFALDSYAAAFDRHVEAKAAVRDRIMPPWLAGPGCNEYLDDRSLTDEQIEILSMWSDAGAPEGDARHPGPEIPGPGVGLSRVDLNLGMPSAYLPTAEPDDYHCFVLDWPGTTTKFITGFRANPGHPEIVHHVLAFYASPGQAGQIQALDDAEPGPGYTCFGGPGTNDSQWLGAWAPGTRGYDFPGGSGMRIEPGSKIILQVHYNAYNSGFVADNTSIDLKLDDSVVKEGWLQPWADPNWVYGDGMLIPAGDPDVKHAWEYDLSALVGGNQALDVYSVGYHQHVRGTHGRVERHGADGSSQCLLDIPRWNFHWQGGYGLAQVQRFDPGDKLYVECHWDNTQANQPYVDGVQLATKDINWGEGTGDEMCLAAVYVTRAD